MLVFLQVVARERFVESGWIVFFESDDDALLWCVFGPGAEKNDACAHLVHLLRKAQVQRAFLSKEFDGIALGVLALVENHREDSLGMEQVTDKFSCFFGVVFGEMRIAAEILENFAEGFVANGIGNQVHVLAVAAKSVVQQFKCSLMDADACDGLSVLGAFRYGFADDFFVFVDDSAFDTFEACEPPVRIQRVPENAFENVTGANASF